MPAHEQRSPSAPADPIVQTAAGAVRGRWREHEAHGATPFRSAAFLGIPFAEAPVGELRFAAPVPKRPWTGVLDAGAFGATAQRGDPGITLIPEPSVPGESTLNVNVFTPDPSARGGDALPVLVWIHGGAYISGSPASPWYDGAAFNRDGVVTVTISYRIGFDGFGWIADAPANRGVLDWLLALTWVQENIAAFGGDPARVTIAGQSAGGGAVLTLLGMPQAQPLFHAAFALSSALADIPLDRSISFGRRAAKHARIEPGLEPWRQLAEEAVLAAQRKSMAITLTSALGMIREGVPLGPVVDGEVIVRPTLDALRAGVGADKPLVIGAVDDEFSGITSRAAGLLRWVPLRWLMALLGVPRSAHTPYIRANAALEKVGKLRLVGRLLSDRLFRVTVPAVAELRPDAATWTYRFAWPSPGQRLAVHCLDVPFFFDCLQAPGTAPLVGEDPPQHVADAFHGAAVAFVRSHDPGWERYERQTRIARTFNTRSRDVPDAYASVRALLAR